MDTTLAGPQEGAMLPDFTLHFRSGHTLNRRNLKGRSHAVIVFLPEHPEQQESPLVRSIAGLIPEWRATRATVLVIIPSSDDGSTVDHALDPVLDSDDALHARFGAGPGGALLVADRYGEIVLRVDGPDALPIREVTPTLELLEMRCSL